MIQLISDYLTKFNHMIPLQDRIKTLVEYSGMSVSDFSRHIGLKSPNAIREIINGRTKTLSDAVSMYITKTYPTINQEWLHKGIGEMYNEHATPTEDVAITLNSGISSHDAMEIIRDYQRQIQELKQQIIEKDARIQQLTDKMLGL